MEEFNRFTTDFSQMEFLDKDKVLISGSMTHQYIENCQQELVFSEKLNIGDVVKLKGLDVPIVIRYVDFYIPPLELQTDYAGYKNGELEENLSLFNQKDIECKIEEKKK